ncbi:MAG: patatin-like phospholipase family protein [Tissierellia bacterium]|nr:patatin-like phospholipase family protein [Tissierellia bacterium]
MGKRPKIGLALGSGAARGLAHIGVLKALEELEIEIHMVSGTSAGALIGGLYCTGISPDMLEKLAIGIDKKMWVDFTLPKKGIIKGERIQEILNVITGNRRIEDLDKELYIVATDLVKGEKVVFSKGSLSQAIRASISIPGIFEPLEYEGKVLVDGAVVDRVPISILKSMGADIIIGVDVGFSGNQNRYVNMLEIILQSIDIMAKQITEMDLKLADLIITPDLAHVNPSKFELVEECSQIGYKATMEKKERILELIGNGAKG